MLPNRFKVLMIRKKRVGIPFSDERPEGLLSVRRRLDRVGNDGGMSYQRVETRIREPVGETFVDD